MSYDDAIDGHLPFVPTAVHEHDGFAVRVVEGEGRLVAQVRGEIDIATCGRLRDAIVPHLGSEQRVVLDLSGVTFMDSACLHVLLEVRTSLGADGGSLVLRNPSAVAGRLLSLAGLSELFHIETSPSSFWPRRPASAAVRSKSAR